MRSSHFVEDYRRHIQNLISLHPKEKAMSLAVGGNFDSIGQLLYEFLRQSGLVNGMNLVDIGCGSGRLARPLAKQMTIEYLGTDVVPELLNYAKANAPEHYQFELVEGLSIPAEAGSADIVCAFSVFTHLLQEETFAYLQECYRVLKPGGKLVFSFLEFDEPSHWPVFQQSVDQTRKQQRSVLNAFIDRGAIKIWSTKLGFELEMLRGGSEKFINLTQPIVHEDGTRMEGRAALWQSACILRKPTP